MRDPDPIEIAAEQERRRPAPGTTRASQPLTVAKGIRFSAAQNIGQRDNQEDAILCAPELGLWVAADGMGGHDRGEDASAAAIAAMRQHAPTKGAPDLAMRAALMRAHAAVKAVGGRCQVTGTYDHKTSCHCRYDRPGSTLTALLLLDGAAIVGHVGDSRCYRFHGGKLEQVTTDHSIGHALLQALGLDEVDPDVAVLPMAGRWLLCTDGLTDSLPAIEMVDILRSAAIEWAAQALIAAALAKGRERQDNVSVIVVEVGQ